MKATKRASRPRQTPRSSVLLAAGSACALLANPAGAIELGEVVVESSLGQPLAASIAYALGPNEQVGDRCVYLRAATPAAGLPAVTRASVTVEGNRLLLRGSTVLREPMMTFDLVVDCPYTARLQRNYLLLLNPPGPASDQARPAAAANRPVASRPSQAPAAAAALRPRARPAAAPRTRRAPAAPIAAGSDYLVQPGDTLSGIVARIDARSLGLWPAIDAVFAENPRAFRDGDVDRLIAGVTLRIPGHLAAQTSVVPALSGPQPAAASAYRGPTEAAVPAAAPADGGAAARASVSASSAQPLPEPAAAATRQPAAPVEPVATTAPVRKTVHLGTPARAPAKTPQAARPTAIPNPGDALPRGEPIPLAEAGDDPAQSWLVWLGGSGVALFLALLVFGRRLRERFSPAVAADDELTQIDEALRNRRSTDRGRPPAEDRSGLDVAGSSGIVGSRREDTDLDPGDDAPVSLDFSFESSGEYRNDLDFIVEELPAGDTASMQSAALSDAEQDPWSEAADSGDTSVSADMKTAELPVAQRSADERATIEVAALDRAPRQSASLDLTTEFDYHVLEKDYEDELSATQALNKEIEQAARELQDSLGSEDGDSGVISVATDLEGTAEITAEMPQDMVPASSLAGNEALDDADVDEETAVSGLAPDEAPTSRLPDSDETVEMDPEATVERRSKTG